MAKVSRHDALTFAPQARYTMSGADPAFQRLVASLGARSPGRQSHSNTAPYISFAILRTKYTGRRQADASVRG